jgi:hypothetical protein
VWYNFSCDKTSVILNGVFMKKTAVNQQLLQLLVSVYNQSIQTYYHFPDVILCGRQRLDSEELQLLLEQDFIKMTSADSFGRTYRLSRKGEGYLFQLSFRRRSKMQGSFSVCQSSLPFA